MMLIRDLREFIELLKKERVQFVIVGGWAVNNYLIPRMTGDIDFFVSRTPQNQDRIRRVLEQFGFADSLPPKTRELLPPGKILMLGRQPCRIDILTEIDGVSFDAAWKARVRGKLDGLPVHFLSPRLLLKNKKSAARAKDMGDIENLKKLLR